MASVHKHQSSPYWQAHFEAWQEDRTHPDGGYFKRKARSTGIPTTEPKRKALGVAAKWEAAGRGLAPDNAHRHSRQFYTESLNDLFKAAGVEPKRLDLSFADYSQTWLAEKQHDISGHTYAKYEKHLRAFGEFLKTRASDPMALIRHSDLQRFYDKQADGLATRTAAAYLKTIGSVLERAHNLGYIDRNPARLVKFRKNVSHSFERKPWTQAEVEKILGYLRDVPEREDWFTACLFGLYLGARLQNACQRRVSEVGLDGDGNPHRITFVPSKKTKAITLPLVGELREHLAMILPERSDLLCPTLLDEPHYSRDFSAIVDAAGVKVRVLPAAGDKGNTMREKSFHSWRHTNKSMMANAGVESRLADLLNNHEDSGVAAGYTHFEVETLETAMRKVFENAEQKQHKA